MSGPLAGLTVLLTRDEGLAQEIRELGAEVRVFAVTRQEPLSIAATRQEPLSIAAERSEPLLVEEGPPDHDWIVFTSPRAVAYWPFPLADGPRLASVGPGTSRAVRERGGKVDLEPSVRGSAALAEELVRAERMEGARVLFPCAEGALDSLEEILAAAGASVTRREIYRTVPAGPMPDGVTDGVDVVVFLAPSAVEAFLDLGGSLTGVAVLAIGPTTAGALEKRGVMFAVAPSADRAGIKRALIDGEFRK